MSELSREAVSRRQFLTGLGAVTTTVVGGLAFDVWGRALPAVASTANGSAKPQGTLVIVELGGGNDGLNTVVPHGDPTYRALRPTLGITDAIDLDGEIGLHPKLARLAARYSAGQVAIIEGIGYPEPDLSHFASMAYWWSGEPHGPSSSGWIGRYLDTAVGFDDPLAGLAIGPGPHGALVGDRSFSASLVNASGLQPRLPAWAGTSDVVMRAWRDLAPAPKGHSTLVEHVRDSIRRSVEASGRLDASLASADSSSVPGRAAAATPGQGTGAASSLALAAELVASDDPPRVIVVHGLGDFDTHQGEAQRHPALMEQLDAGIETFFTTLDARGAAERALVVTTSEFGRRASENGSGTDHGTANSHFVIGAGVKGGRHGERPSLTDVDDNGNLKHSVDFRSLYATLLDGWLGADPVEILGKGHEPLPLFSTEPARSSPPNRQG